MPFTRYFYFKKDTPADTDWKIKARERNGVAARELGGYRAYGEEAWNDELLVTDLEEKGKGMGRMGLAEPKHLFESLLREARVRAVEGKDGAAVEVQEGDQVHVDRELQRPMGRWTEADRKGDVRRLDRQLARTLYLVVKREEGGWGFPAGELVERENLHQVGFLFSWEDGGKESVEANWITGCRESARPDCRCQHEYLDRWPRPSWPPHHQATVPPRKRSA
jgi:large subunit ribosomal protein L46